MSVRYYSQVTLPCLGFALYSSSLLFILTLLVKCESRSVVSTLCNPMDYTVHGILRPEYWNGSHSLLQGIFPTQGSNLGLLHCREILYQLSHRGSPRILEWVVYPFSSSFPNSGIESASPALQADSLPAELSRKAWKPIQSSLSESSTLYHV